MEVGMCWKIMPKAGCVTICLCRGTMWPRSPGSSSKLYTPSRFLYSRNKNSRRTACQVDPAVSSVFSSSTTSFMPPLARWYAKLVPTHPPPMMTVSAVSFHLFLKAEDASLKKDLEQLQVSPFSSNMHFSSLFTMLCHRLPATRADILESPCWPCESHTCTITTSSFLHEVALINQLCNFTRIKRTAR